MSTEPVKVLCFDTLLQVLILKVVKVAVSVLFATLPKVGSGQKQRVTRKCLGYPHPGCFGKRGCKLLKTKDGSRKKRTKRLQEIDRSEDGGEVAGCEGSVLGPGSEAAVLVYGAGPLVQEFALLCVFVGAM